jgi:phosphoribosylamine--glycine ligase
LRILVIGGGAREHTLVWKLNQSPNVKEIYVAPGNAGTGLIAQNLDIGATDLETLAQAAEGKNIELTVVGPEVPLAQGIVDLFHSRRIPCFGPTREATKIESSKVFAKELMHKYGIPCAQSRSFSSFDEARAYLQRQQPPIVVKADGLAAGKGSIVAQSQEEALEALSEIMEKRIFGAAGDQVLIEECLEGNEVSLLAFTDGKTANRVKDTILEPTVEAMAKEGKPFKGVLYAGLIMTLEGPKALEFNARFGDPENQVMIPRLKSDLLEVMLAVIDGTLDRTKVEWSNEACVGVVMASGGYPGSYTTGFPIEGCDEVDNDILVFHAGTKAKGGTIYTDGGRVLTVAAMGKTIAEARSRVYLNLPRIRFEGCHYRTDIAAREQS